MRLPPASAIASRAKLIGPQVALGSRLIRVAGDTRSRLLLPAIALFMLVKHRTPWSRRPIRLVVTFPDRARTVYVSSPTELEVLEEILLNREYELSPHGHEATIIDLGAHVGFASLYFAAVRPNARIIAVEANPGLIPLLRRNLAGTNVEVIHAAIGRERGEREFYTTGRSWSGSLFRTDAEAHTVPALTLADITQDVSGGIDLLKLDVEGAEWEILAAGFPAGIKRILGEAHPGPGGRTPADLLRHLEDTAIVEPTRWQDNEQTVVFWARPRRD